MSTTPLLRVDKLCIGFTNNGTVTPALQQVSLNIHKGELVAVVGESGSGKSITALSVLRLLPSPPALYSGGHIYFSENDAQPAADLLQYSQQQMEALRGNRIAMIFQEPMTSLNPVHTCGHQVMEALLQHSHLTQEAARSKTLSLFGQVQLPDPLRIFNSYPHQISGGQKQRVMIAMAMSTEPALLICDEPTTALDVTVQQNILLLIKQLQQQRDMGVLFITHDLAVVAEIADSIVVLYKGKIVEQGPAKQLLRQPQHPYTKALLACRPALHAKGERLPVVADFLQVNSDGEITEKPMPPAAQAPAVTAQQPPVAASPLITVKELNVWFPSQKNWLGKPLQYTKAVNNVSFDVLAGETLGLVGESGCGKSTLGRALLRLIEPTSGTVHFKGKELVHMPQSELKQLRKDMQIIFQDPYSSLNPRMTIGDAIAEPLKVHRIGKNEAERKEMVMDLLQKVNLLPEHYYRYPHAFSGGQRQRIVIARALALQPSFVICDESVSALDVSVQAQVLNLLNDLKKTFGFTAIFISHDLSVVKYISDRIMVMNKGRIEETGNAEQIYHHPQSSYTQRLIEAIPKL